DAARDRAAIVARRDPEPESREAVASRVVVDVVHVGPDLAVERRAARVEDADDGPEPSPEREARADAARGVARDGAASDHDLADVRPEGATFDDPDRAVHGEGDRLDPADEDVLAPAAARVNEGLVHEFARRERMAGRVAGDAGERAQRLRRVARHLAR